MEGTSTTAAATRTSVSRSVRVVGLSGSWPETAEPYRKRPGLQSSTNGAGSDLSTTIIDPPQIGQVEDLGLCQKL
jgi:hypothetical protein